MTRIYLAQINPIIADFENNAKKIISAIKRAKQEKCSLIITPELALCGYPPKDLLYYPSFIEKQDQALHKIVHQTQGITLILGAARKLEMTSKKLANSAFIIQDQRLIDYYDKRLLPNYDVFDEKRYFEPGKATKLIDHQGKKIALTICEDIWAQELSPLYPMDPLDDIASKKPDLLINLSASPFEVGKLKKRIEIGKRASKKVSAPLLFCNQIGGHDSLIFSGSSFAVNQDDLLLLAQGFEETHLTYDTEKKYAPHSWTPNPMEGLKNALILGIKDYFFKQGFSKALIALSGGIDSALVTTLSAMALKPENVLALSMPSRYSSKGSVEDSQALCKNLGVELKIVPIEQPHQLFDEFFKVPFKGMQEDETEENIQSRIRAIVLMAYSNKLKRLVLSCGNKSELALGYATLYGDLAGGLAPLSDLSKTKVYELANYLNHNKEIIPSAIVKKPPSAELKPDQKDSDTLPGYSVIDSVIEGYIENHLEASQISTKYNLDLSVVHDLIKKIHKNEYKRRQTPLGFKLTKNAFSMGRRIPIVHALSDSH